MDVILDIVGGAYLARNLEVLGTDGRLVQVGIMGGGADARLNLTLLLRKRQTITGSMLRARSTEQKGAIANPSTRRSGH